MKFAVFGHFRYAFSMDFEWSSIRCPLILDGFRWVSISFSLGFEWFAMHFHLVLVCFIMGCPLFSIGFPLLSFGPPSLFYWFSLVFNGSLHSSIGLPLAFLNDPLILLLYSPLFSNVFLIVL